MNTKNKNSVRQLRDRNGRFTSVPNLRPSAVYFWEKSGTPVRFLKYTQNRLALVQYLDSFYAMANPAQLSRLTKSEVRQYLDSI
jgi:hypothetical protein